MKKVNQWIALLCAVLLCAGLLPAAFAAEDKIIAKGTGGEGITWTLTDDGILTVSGNGPITDKEEIEYNDDGEISSISKLDSISWQLDAVLEPMTKGRSVKDAAMLRYNFVKTLILEEGITSVPDNEFDTIYPRTIVLPATLQELGYAAINAQFAESVTVNGKDTIVTSGILIASYHSGAKPYASIDKALAASAAAEAKSDKISRQVSIVYDTRSAYEIKRGLNPDTTKKEFLAYFNETYGKSYTKLTQCISYGLKRINKIFGTDFSSIQEVFIEVKQEDGSISLELNQQIEEKIWAMYDANDISPRLDTGYIGEIDLNGDQKAYTWLTVSGPSGSDAEEAAKASGLPFHATTAPEKPTLLQRVRQFFEQLQAKIETMLFLLKLSLPGFALPKLS